MYFTYCDESDKLSSLMLLLVALSECSYVKHEDFANCDRLTTLIIVHKS